MQRIPASVQLHTHSRGMTALAMSENMKLTGQLRISPETQCWCVGSVNQAYETDGGVAGGGGGG